ncbi:hypothetical protein C3L33_00768, partial [Rhododendron williamsianum]
MASPSFKHLAERKLGRFPHFVVYALLEWTLIFLLFIDGFLAFVSNEFAKFFDLKIPCLLCTRIDHVLVHRNSNFYYNDSICESHKRDISSLAYCHMHRKLSDIRSMCEGCLLSFATERESDTDAYKSLVGILHKDIDTFMEDDHRISHRQPYLGKRDDAMKVEKSGVHRCSCCGEALKMKPSSSMNASFLSQAPAPSPRAPVLTWKNEESRNLELPHIRYTELKFMSDNESEIPDDEDSQCKEENKAASVPLLPDTEDIIEEAKTPNFTKGNRFFGIPLTDSAAASPRWASRFQKKFLFEKSDFFSESNDGNETEGDSILHSLKRQVRLDRKSLIAMYMELDEERSASAVAANNAMAMITRLQAEKAAVQMEALQYQRMMEEQAEYDQEAVQVMKDLLAKREEEIKGLEAELDTYRERYGQINRVGSDECEVDADEDYQELKSQSLSPLSEKSDCGSPNGGNQIAENGHNRERSGPLQEESNENKAILTKEVSFIKERLKAIEADSGFLKHAAMTLQKGGEGTKLLTEIALHLRKLRRSLKVPSQDIDA